jgi:Uma2 family endonuclease
MRATAVERKQNGVGHDLNGALIDRFAALPAGFYRLSLKQYHRMIDAGILNENDRVELLDGFLVAKMTRKPPHDGTIGMLLAALQSRLSGDWHVRVQSAITISTDGSEPEPDLVVVRGSPRRYMRSHPHSKDTGLLIEVADTTLEQDRNFKCWLYAKARISIYWIVNLVESQVEVYTRPGGTGQRAAYQHHEVYGLDQSVPLVVDGKKMGSIPVRTVLP